MSRSAASRFHRPSPHRSARSSAFCRTMRAGCSRERRWPATLRARVGCSGCRNIGGRRHGSDRRAAPARPRSEHGSAAPLSFPASAHPPCRVRGDARLVGDWAHTSAVPHCLRRAARRLRRALTTSNAPRARATSAQSPFCARRVRAPRGSHRQARRTGSPTHFASFRRARPRRERIELLLARSAAQTASGHFADSHSVLLEAVAIAPDDATVARRCAAVESLLGRHEQAGARLASAIERLPDQGSPEAVGTHERARGESRLASAIRRDARVRRARSGRGDAARRPALDRGGTRPAHAGASR